MDDFQQKMYANRMEPIFKKMKIGDRGIFDSDGKEYFIAKQLPKLSVGAYRDRKYILPIAYIHDIDTGLKLEAGYQITAGYFGKHFTYVEPAQSVASEENKKPSLDAKIRSASEGNPNKSAPENAPVDKTSHER